MRSIRFALSLLIAWTLTVGAVVAVNAQDDPMAPAAVLGWALDETWVADGESTEVDGMLQRRGPQWSYTFTADDARLSGAALWTGNGNRYDAEPMFEVQRSRWELSNDDGSWSGESLGLQGPGLGESDTITLTGAGGYEGLTAHLVMDWGLGGGRFRGAIFPGEMPPLP